MTNKEMKLFQLLQRCKPVIEALEHEYVRGGVKVRIENKEFPITKLAADVREALRPTPSPVCPVCRDTLRQATNNCWVCGCPEEAQ